jgi:hypothetical protein
MAEQPDLEPRRLSDRRLLMIIGLLALFTHAYFYNGVWVNQNARLNSIFSFVEPGPHQWTFQMDPFMYAPEKQGNTDDWSKYNGHYYPNKAPATMALGAAVYMVLYHGERIVGLDPLAPRQMYINAYLIHVGVSVVPLAAVVPLFFLLASRWTDRRKAFWATAVFGWGTLLLPFSTQLWGHSTVAACWIAFVFFADEARARWFLCGVFGGLAVLVEYLSALGVMVVGVVLVVDSIRRHREGEPGPYRRLALYTLGGLGPLALHALYHQLCFGAPLITANAYQNQYFSQDDLVLGMFGQLRLSSLWGITFSAHRGLFYSSPVLLLIVPGFVYWYRSGRNRLLFHIAWSTIVVHLLTVASFNGWHAGASFGPRYLIAALPFAVLALLFVPWKEAAVRMGSFALAALSGLAMLLPTVVTPAIGEQVKVPMLVLWRLFSERRLAPLQIPIRDHRGVPPEAAELADFNLGTLCGLPGYASLLPWLAVLIGVGIFLWKQTEAEVGEPVDEQDSVNEQISS